MSINPAGTLHGDDPWHGWQNRAMSSARPSAIARIAPVLPGALAPGGRLQLPEPSAHHALRVLRLVPGDAVRIFNGDGSEWAAEIAAVNKSGASVLVSGRVERDVEARPSSWRKASRARAHGVHLAESGRIGCGRDPATGDAAQRGTPARERASRRIEHWQNLVIAACEQCGRTESAGPSIETFTNWLGALPNPISTSA